MKVRLQNNPNISLSKNILNCLQNEGIRGFFKGMSLPIASISVLNAFIFAGNEISKSQIGKEKDDDLTILESTICGFFAGAFVTPYSTFVENVKCKLQIQINNKENSYYKGVYDLLNKTYKLEGIKGVFKGNIVNFFREVFGYAGQFGSYHAIKLLICKYNNIEFSKLSNTHLLFAGGVSGSFAWLTSYPFDIIKTLIQTGKIIPCQDQLKNEKLMKLVNENEAYFKESGIKFYNYNTKYFDGGLISAANHIYIANGFKGFWIGFVPVVLLNFLGNGLMFVIYERVKEYLTERL